MTGFFGTPAWPWLQATLTGEPMAPKELIESLPKVAGSIALIAFGVTTGWILYGRRQRVDANAADPVSTIAPGVFRFLGARMKFDEFYAATIGRIFTLLGVLAAGLDRRILETIVEGVGRLAQWTGRLNRKGDERGLNAGFNSATESARRTGKAYSHAQSGDAHTYLRVIAAAFVVLLLIAVSKGGR